MRKHFATLRAAVLMMIVCCGPQSASAPSASMAACQGAACDVPASTTSPALGHNSDGPPAFCQRDGSDRVRDLFCQDTPPTIHSMADLQAALELDPSYEGVQRSQGGLVFSDPNLKVNFVVTLSHSTALSGHLVSPINPRVFVISLDAVLAYQRGVQRVELAVRARDGGAGFNLYLIEFSQACNDSEAGCTYGDLFTPSVESDWNSVDVHDDEDLKNTAFDCRQCHKRGSDTTQLLMREFDSPWTHFFLPLLDTTEPHAERALDGTDLTRDYVQAKGDESYANVPIESLRHSPPVVLQGLAGMNQPLVFNVQAIQAERWPAGATDGPQPSPTWEASYDAFKRGEHLALPYHEPRATDPLKQSRLTDAYTQYRNGELSADELPDLADIFPDDPQLRARIGLQTEPDATPAEALIQACGSCHNDVLDQTISRARFNVDVSRLDRAELERAIERITLPRTEPGAMPPPEARQLAPEARQRLLSFLRDDKATHTLDSSLQRAAELGMAVPLTEQ